MKTFLFALLTTGIVFSQAISWTDISSEYNFPDGVKLFKGTRTSPVLNCWYIEVDLKQNGAVIKPYFNPAGREGITAFSQRFNTIAAINGGYFDTQTGASYSALVNSGSVQAKNIASVVRDSRTYFLTRGFFSIEETRDLSVDWIYHFGNRPIDIYSFANPNPNVQGTPAPSPTPLGGTAMYEIIAGIGGGPVLIKDGQIRITYDQEVFWGSGVGLTNNDPRSAVGYTQDKRIILFVADGRQATSNGISLTELATTLKQLGCVEAMNLDGGGSSQMAVGTTLINRPEGGTFQRPIPTMLAVVRPDSLPLLPAAYYNQKRDTEDSSACTLTGTWTFSNISGWWGGTPARLAQVGDNNNRAEFTLNLPAAGTYNISAWWVAASDRARNTPYIVYHANGVDTIRFDQSVNGLKWNTLGSFTFTGTSSDKVVVSNKATGGSVICVDALRILSFDSLLTSSDESQLQTPAQYEMLINYPNPFNPETTLTYSVKEPGNIRLSVYNVLGKEVEVLSEEYHSSGTYVKKFTPGNVASGVYIAVLRTPSGIVLNKMLMLK